MSASYNIIQGPHLSEGLLSQNAESYKSLGDAVGSGITGAVNTIKRRRAEDKQYGNDIENKTQAFRDENRLQNPLQADREEHAQAVENSIQAFKDYTLKLPRNERYGAKSIAMYNSLKNALGEMFDKTKQFHESYANAVNSKEPDINKYALEQHYQNELSKPTYDREPINLNNPKFRNIGSATSSFLHSISAKDLAKQSYTEKTKDGRFLLDRDLVYNPTFYSHSPKNNSVYLNNLRPMSERLVQEKPYIAQHILETDKDVQLLWNTGDHKAANELALRKIEDGLLKPTIESEFQPQNIIKKSDELSLPSNYGGSGSKEEQTGEAIAKRTNYDFHQVMQSNPAVIENIQAIAKLKNIIAKPIFDDKATFLDNVNGDVSLGRKIIGYKFITQIDKTMKNEDGSTYTEPVSDVKKYDFSNRDQKRAFKEELINLRGGGSAGAQTHAFNILNDENEEEIKKEQAKSSDNRWSKYAVKK
jgi:hypothetical protein